MRALAVVVLLLTICLPSCSMAYGYETEQWRSSVETRNDGRANALGRDLRSITDTIDRHFFNYSKDDPYVNYESRSEWYDHVWRFPIDLLSPIFWPFWPW